MKTIYTIFITLLMAIPSYGYPPVPEYDNHCSLQIFGNNLVFRHFEGRRGWSAAETDGPKVAVYLGNSELVQISRSSAICIAILSFLFVIYLIRKLKQRKLVTCSALAQ